jgi:hypothetical protein
LTKKAPYKGLGADSEEKHEPVSDIDTVEVDSLKVLDPNRPIREADNGTLRDTCVYSIIASEWPTVKAHLTWQMERPRQPEIR